MTFPHFTSPLSKISSSVFKYNFVSQFQMVILSLPSRNLFLGRHYCWSSFFSWANRQLFVWNCWVFSSLWHWIAWINSRIFNNFSGNEYYDMYYLDSWLLFESEFLIPDIIAFVILAFSLFGSASSWRLAAILNNLIQKNKLKKMRLLGIFHLQEWFLFLYCLLISNSLAKIMVAKIAAYAFSWVLLLTNPNEFMIIF